MSAQSDRSRVEALIAALRRTERQLPRSGLGRLFKTGRSAAGLAASVLGSRFRGHGGGVGAADAEAVGLLVTRLGELKGVAMKAGQILGYVDPTLPEEVRALLSVLQTQAPASPTAAVEATVREAFGARADELLSGLDRRPIAVASIGQVHRARLPDGAEVAVKIRHPGIDEALRSDLKAAGTGASFASALVPGGGSTVMEFVDEARTALTEECDYALEARRQARFRALFAGDATIRVPAVFEEWCAPAVLTTEWLSGTSFDAFLAGGPSQEQRDRLGVALFAFYLGTLYRHGLFHADPHPGNYAVLEDGTLAVYDFGCVREFDRPSVRAFADLVRAVRDDDRERERGALVQMGATPPSGPEATERLRTLLRSFFAPLLTPGPRLIDPDAGYRAKSLFDDKRFLTKLSLPGRFLFLFRLRFGLYAVLARLGAIADWAGLESAWAEEARDAGSANQA